MERLFPPSLLTGKLNELPPSGSLGQLFITTDTQPPLALLWNGEEWVYLGTSNAAVVVAESGAEPPAAPSGAKSLVMARWFADGPLAAATEFDGVWSVPVTTSLQFVLVYLGDTGESGVTSVGLDYSQDGGRSWSSLLSPADLAIPAGGGNLAVYQFPGEGFPIPPWYLLRSNIADAATGARNITVLLTGVALSVTAMAPGELVPPSTPPPEPPLPYLYTPKVAFARAWVTNLYMCVNFDSDEPEWASVELPPNCGALHRIELDQENGFVYLLTMYGLYRALFESGELGPWEQVLDLSSLPDSLPEGLRERFLTLSAWNIAAATSGNVYMVGLSSCQAGGEVCTGVDPNLGRGSFPLLLRISPDLQFTVLDTPACELYCCYYHDSDHWRYYPTCSYPPLPSQHFLLALTPDDKLMFPSLCYKGSWDGFPHMGVAGDTDNHYALYMLERPYEGDKSFLSLAAPDSGTAFGFFDGRHGWTRGIYRVTLDDGSMTMVSPEDFNENHHGLSISHDGSSAEVVLSDVDRVYLWDGEAFQTKLVRTELDDPPDEFHHCTGYSGRKGAYFLACQRAGSGPVIIYTPDSFATIQDKTGTGIDYLNIAEIRAFRTAR